MTDNTQSDVVATIASAIPCVHITDENMRQALAQDIAAALASLSTKDSDAPSVEALSDAIYKAWEDCGSDHRWPGSDALAEHLLPRLTALTSSDAVLEFRERIQETTREARGGPQFPEVHRVRVVRESKWVEGPTAEIAKSRLAAIRKGDNA